MMQIQLRCVMSDYERRDESGDRHWHRRAGSKLEPKNTEGRHYRHSSQRVPRKAVQPVHAPRADQCQFQGWLYCFNLCLCQNLFGLAPDAPVDHYVVL